jgi:hypothetical protein
MNHIIQPTNEFLRRHLGIPDDAERVLVFLESSHWDPDWLLTSEEYYDRFVRSNLDQDIEELQREPLRRFLRLKQRNWPAKSVQRSTRQLYNRLNHLIAFFIQYYSWSEWRQLTPHWLEDYIDAKLREGKHPERSTGISIIFGFLPVFD